MRKYRLCVQERVTYERVVTADSESEAEEKFMNMTPVGQQCHARNKRREIMDIEVFEDDE